MKKFIISLVVIGGLAGLYMGISPLKTAVDLVFKSPASGEKYAYFGNSEYVITTADGREAITIKNQNGAPAPEAMGLLINGKIVYLSPYDMGVRSMTPGGVGKWIAVAPSIGSDAKPTRISTDGTYMYIAFRDAIGTASVSTAGRPLETIQVDIDGGVAKTFAKEMDITPLGGNSSIARNQEGEFIFTQGNESTTLCTYPNAYKWDYDANSGVLALANGGSVIVVKNGEETSFTPAFMHSIQEIHIDTIGLIWVSLHRPFGGARVVVYNTDGTEVGLKVADKSRASGPYIPVTVELKEFLGKS